MRAYLRTMTALDGKVINRLYALADSHGVGLGLMGGSKSPGFGPAEWEANGSLLRLRRFVHAAREMTPMDPISKPKYPPAPRWTDAARWEKKGRDY